MATLYLRSTDGSNSDNGTTWALAKATAVGIDAIDAAGDTIYVSQVHAEETAGAVAINFAGTAAAPTKVICGNDGAAPPTAAAATAVISTGAITVPLVLNTSGVVFWEGILFKAGVGAASSGATLHCSDGGGSQRFHNCEFWTSTTGGSAATYTGGSSTAAVIWHSCNYKPAATGHTITTIGTFRWIDGALLSGSAAVTTLVTTDGLSEVYIEGVDLSNAATALALCSTPRQNDSIIFNMCKLPASWSGVLNGATTGEGAVIRMLNCAAGAVNYAYWLEKLNGSARHETTIVRTGGATDGVTPISWKIVTTANASWEFPFVSDRIAIKNNTTGSNLTVTIYGTWSGGAVPTNAEISIRVIYMGSSGSPLATINNTNTKTDFIATAANQTADATSTWGGGTTKFKMVVTLSSPQPGMKGPIYFEILAYKASTTFYIDPEPDIA